MNKKPPSIALCALWLAALIPSGAMPTTTAGPTPPGLSAADAQSFFDGLLAEQLTAYAIPGATLSIVKDGEVLLARGYGFSDVEQQTPVSADTTLFHLASISKVFVWTSVMQLVEQHRLDLDTDVNDYLTEFQIADDGRGPVTLADLMSHAAGFEERALGTSALQVAELEPLGVFLAAHQPTRVFRPGQLSAYSNYGSALAGYIVSQVAGVSFSQYVERDIFQPLEMPNSTFDQPVPARLAANLSKGFTYSAGQYAPHEPEWSQLAPAAALRSTARDMGHFMIAQLQDGRYGTTRILESGTAKAMQTQSFTNDPGVNGFAHGFLVATLKQRRLLWHGGDVLHFHAGMFLLPDENVGLFVAYNSADAQRAVFDTVEHFLNRYFPAEEPYLPAVPDSGFEIGDVAGTYFPARAEYTTAGRLVAMLQSVRVTVDGAHDLVVTLGFPPQATWHYRQVGPHRFASDDLHPSLYGDLVFRRNAHDSDQVLLLQNNPTTAYLRAPWYGDPWINLALLTLCCLAFVTSLAGIATAAPMSDRSRAGRFAVGIGRVTSAVNLLFLFGFGLIFANPDTVFGLPGWAYGVFLLPYVSVVGALGLSVLTVLVWRRRTLPIARRVSITGLTVAAIAFAAWLAVWNLWVTGLY